jgi:hypothetical protein
MLVTMKEFFRSAFTYVYALSIVAADNRFSALSWRLV